jgi:2-polyprenyl-6-methoxyphenol hydroxylase-like FAD-dependent oxidoreductase
MTQVVIIGAGPTGLTLAMLLVKRGIAVKVIEAARGFQRVFRGEALMPSGLAAIGQMGLADLIDHLPHRAIDAWEMHIEDRCLFRVEEPMDASGKPCMLVSQPAFLAAIVEQLQAYPQFELLQGVSVQDLWWEGDAPSDRLCQRVSGVQLSNGQKLAADLVIGADGRNSLARQKAKLELIQSNQSFDILWFKLPMAAQFERENVFYSFLKGREGFGFFRGSAGDMQLGWSIHRDHPIDWQNTDWAETFASASPEWLATYFRSLSGKIEKPMLLSITVGRCPQWHKPGLLLLGDSAHPMSPIRAQGINMALRDVVVAANYLIPVLSESNNLSAIDAVLPQIQADREPEIIKTQQLQQQEINQGELIRNVSPVRHMVSRLAPVIRPLARKSWLDRQLQLRQGLSEITLKV